MVCYNPKPCKFEKFEKIDEKTGEIYETKRPKFVSWHEVDLDKWYEWDYLPCGKCEGCQIDKANQWATRACLEAQNWPINCFLTLTYNNDSIAKKRTLIKADLQKFWKRLRKTEKGVGSRIWKSKIEHPIRYMTCGEYGPKTLRPHYHAAIFNWAPNDLIFYKHNTKGQPLFTSEKLNKIWGLGYVIVGNLDYESAAYVARYTVKKAYGLDKDWNCKHGREPEFILTSRAGGIGYKFELQKIKDNSGVWAGGQIKPVPNFIRQKWKNLDREGYNKYFEKQAEIAKENMVKILAHTSKNYYNYAQTHAQTARARAKRLDKRNNI